ncbi:protein SUO [Citrus sinensis]|uniref:Protein SUO n=1 Tax=Citrus sinensis TaxID=2711 RepID=A0ACB8LS86_CITSI|nr:protein SUO [Citrus sinensis]
MRMRMHGWRAGEEEGDKKREGRRRHMWTVPPRDSAILASVADGGSASPSSSSSLSSSPNSVTFFSQDGRKISVGDCALFKPPQDSPPFIGIIRSLTAGKENKLTLSVNWLYRPAEVKLGKGFLLEAAPNEIFYSFHKDEIPAASLLHPCKVAFLPKGIELPSGIGSFVCRKERQEEVDQLLYKTHIEMHATVPSGGRSPKPMNGPTSTSQLKPGSDGAQNSASFPSQVKGKKRERGDQSSEPVKRERSSKMEDGNSGHSRTETNLKTEIAKITEKGGLVDYDGVEKLVQLMVPERNDKKIDLVCRSLLAGVVAATDKFDCLNWFVQLRGLLVFDEWLQEVHKGKIGDAGSPRDGDKSVEEFLLILLRALDKLPVNLNALQMCNIGKSVNHLRTHKNVEIQKKARSLVDTWKKRVEAEMDARPRLPEVPHSGNRQTGASSEVAIKSLVTQPASSKTGAVKLCQGDAPTKSAFSSPVSVKSAPLPASGSTDAKDGQPRNAASATGTTDLPSTPAKDEKSSSSSQSHNNGQSCVGDHAKTGGLSGKEDARSSATVSMTLNKISVGSSRSRKSVNGYPSSTPAGVQRETVSSKNATLHRNSASDRPSQPSLTCEKALDVPVVEGANPKIIVKIPNRGRSPAQNSSGGSVEDTSVTNSRASSPVLPEKQNQFDRNFKEKNDALRADISSNMNSEPWQSNVNKDAAACPDEGSGSPAVLPDEQGGKTGDNCRKVVEDLEDNSLPPGYEFKDVKLHESSFSSMNALIESCVKYSEANVSAPAGDDIGMNLLASVAAGEMSKSDVVSPVGSLPRTPIHEPLCDDNDSRVKSFPGDHSTDSTDDEHEKQGIDRNLWAKNSDSNQDKPAGGLTGHISASPVDVQQSGDPCQENTENSKEIIVAEETPDGAGRNPEDDKAGFRVDADGAPDGKQRISGPLSTEDKVSESTRGVETEAVEGSASNQSLEFDGENKKGVSEGLNSGVKREQKPSPITTHSESVKGKDGELLHTSGSGEDMPLKNVDEVKVEKADEVDSKSHVNQTEEQNSEWKSNAPMIREDRVVPHLGSAENEEKGNGKVDHRENLEGKEVKEELCAGPALPEVSTALRAQETGQLVRTGAVKLTISEGDKAQESTSTTIDAASSAVGVSDMEAKVEFDLNEGFDGDDGKYGESSNFIVPGCSGVVQQLVSPLPLPVTSVSSSLPSSVTVAAAAKGPFVPPEDLLRSKVELGWKGSAATSAFRPAEPRKILEMPLGATSISVPDSTSGKLGRPLLDIDLNVPDERVLEDLASRSSVQDTVTASDHTNNRDGSRCEVMGSKSVRGSVGLDLDLNRAEELIDIGNYSTSNGNKIDVPVQPGTSSGGLLNGEVNVRRDFDLNDGPVLDDCSAEPSVFPQHPRNVSQAPVSGLRLSSADTVNFSSWFPRGNTYSTIAVPSVLPDRGEQPFPIIAPCAPQRMLAPPTSGSPFGPDVFRGPVLSSSPAVPFPSAPFQYPVFPFGTSFPLPSATFSGGTTTYVDSSSGGRFCFPAVNSQLMGPAGAVPSHFPRPYVVSLPDGSNSASSESSWKRSRQSLDLNAGPGVPDIEGRDETSPLVPRQLSVASSQVLTEDQARMYQQMAGGHFKRKEPEGGWDGYKRPSWQ